MGEMRYFACPVCGTEGADSRDLSEYLCDECGTTFRPMADEIRPALTPEQWLNAIRAETPERRLGIAAVALHGQPFGFRWEDVDLLRALATWIPPEWRSREADYRRIADRIAALLPPREP